MTGHWNCSSCTVKNRYGTYTCKVCSAVRPPIAKRKAKAMTAPVVAQSAIACAQTASVVPLLAKKQKTSANGDLSSDDDGQSVERDKREPSYCEAKRQGSYTVAVVSACKSDRWVKWQCPLPDCRKDITYLLYGDVGAMPSADPHVPERVKDHILWHFDVDGSRMTVYGLRGSLTDTTADFLTALPKKLIGLGRYKCTTGVATIDKAALAADCWTLFRAAATSISYCRFGPKLYSNPNAL